MCSEPFVFGGELADWQELAVRGTLLAASLAWLFIGVGIEVVVVDMLGSVLSMDGIGDRIESAVWNVVPTGLGLIGEEEISTVLPAKPLVHLLWEIPDLVAWLFVQPVV